MYQIDYNTNLQLLLHANKIASDVIQLRQRGIQNAQLENKLKQQTMELTIGVDNLFIQFENLEKQNKLSKIELQKKKSELLNLELQLQYLQKLQKSDSSMNQNSQQNKQLEQNNQAQNHSDLQLLTEPIQQIQQQTQQLEEFSEVIQRIKLISFDMHDEFDLHVQLLNKVDSNIDQASDKVNKTNKKLSKILNSASVCKLSCATCTLFTSLLCIVFFL